MRKSKKKTDKLITYIALIPDTEPAKDEAGVYIRDNKGYAVWRANGYTMARTGSTGPVAGYSSYKRAKDAAQRKTKYLTWRNVIDTDKYPPKVLKIDLSDYIDEETSTLEEQITHAENVLVKKGNKLKELEQIARDERK